MTESDSPSAAAPASDEHADRRIEAPSLAPPPGADEPPLPDGALLRFQRIYMGEGTAGNYRFIIYDDGRVLSQDNGESDSDPPILFTAPYPTQPTKVLDGGAVERLRGLVRARGFLSLAPGYAADHKVFGGDLEILEVRIDGKEHRVIMDRTRHPVFTAVRDAAHAMIYGN